MLKQNQKQIVVGMSGGVDSSMALVLLKEQGWQPIGVSLKYAVWRDKTNLLRENVCCSADSFKIAREICKKLAVPYHIFDVSKEFKKKVIGYFTNELKNNRTPNPCVICNRYLKFKKLFEFAKKNNIKYVATGHYARIKKNIKSEKYELLKAKDKKKDQTYSLCFLPQEWLKRIIFPLGEYTKTEVYKMAKEKGFKFFLKTKQSQNFCFVAGKSLNSFLKKELGKKVGDIKNFKGNVLGKHQGLHFFTIGQRKGINLAGGPYFVAGMDKKNNVLLITKDKNKLLQKQTLLSPCHFFAVTTLKNKISVQVKIRSHQNLTKAILAPLSLTSLNSKNKIKLIFDRPQTAITPGQFAVFYKGNVCLGGGKII